MKTSLKNVAAITLFVEDPQRSKRFYLGIFDVEAIYEDETSVAFGFEDICVNLVTIPSAQEMIEPGIVASRNPGFRFQLTVNVDSVDAACAELTARGVELLNGPINRDWGVRTAIFTDPDGHLWEIAQPIAAKEEAA